MKGEWCYFKQKLSQIDCAKILEYSEDLPSQRSEIGTDQGITVDDTYRRSEVKFIQQNDLRFEPLFDSVWKMAIQANQEWFRFNITKLSYIQLAKYDSSEQGEYKKHHDVFWINGDPEYHRKLTCVIQLTDPSEYEGGDLELYDLNQYPNPEEIKTQGTAIFFPSFISHAALPVTKGVRHSLACWFDGPKWQ